MKKSLHQTRLLYSVITITILLFSISIYPQANLVINPDFENNSSAWTFSSGATKPAFNSFSGSFAVNAIDNSGASQTILNLTPNTTYLLTGWLKSSNNTVVNLGVKWYGGNELTAQTTSISYSLLSLKFTTGPASTTAAIYIFNPSDGNNVMNADDLSLTQTTETPYILVWSDEFNTDGAVNPANWSFENGYVRNEEQQWYQPDNAFQKEGNLIFEARKENPFNSRLNPNFVSGSTDWKRSRRYINYTAASIHTRAKKSWLYGRFEIRAKVTNQDGTWPAIWTLGNSCEWPSNGEVDIMENYGGNVLANYAWGTNTRWSARWDTFRKSVPSLLNKDAEWLSKFHIWTLDWDVNRMSIYLDGELLNEVDLTTTFNGTSNCSGQNPFRQPHYLLLNLALISNATTVSTLTFPTQYIVDYARVYQLDTSLSTNNNIKPKNSTIYPNPFKNILTINDSENNPNFKVYDSVGKVLIKGNGSKVDGSILKKGVYFIKVENQKPIKIIKE